ncbi:DUF1906 domain-containing protein [Kitasatospora sp. NPDC094015]|uniref:DUF1906 domain-containing protein n=1 Tax=Kitasatospora sp. NPDC094015 TaxID=3155205 RepID=UPI003318DB08
MRHLTRRTALAAAALALLLPAATATARADDPGPEVAVVDGLGFDTCTAPPLATMRTWWDDSPYEAVGIYLSGSQRACRQPELTAAWVREVQAMGWRLIPTHVGLQAPCSAPDSKPRKFDPDRAREQGRQEADEAVAALTALGLGQGSPVYLDIEAYGPAADPACGAAVVDAAVGWTEELHRAGYLAGFYSSSDSGVRDLVAAARAGRSPLPDALWYARWDRREDTGGSGAVPDDLWTGHRRIHQYEGDVPESWGGVSLSIDRNRLDGPVAVTAGAPDGRSSGHEGARSGMRSGVRPQGPAAAGEPRTDRPLA